MRDQVRSVAEKYKGMNKKREKLWSMFHKIRMGSKLSSLWINLMGKLGIVIEDPLLEQSFYQNIFEVVIKEYFECSRSEYLKQTAYHQRNLTYFVMHVDM